MEQGMIARLNEARGFGFISRQDGSTIFFHMSALGDRNLFASLVVDQQVEFDVVDSPKGKQASRIVLL